MTVFPCEVRPPSIVVSPSRNPPKFSSIWPEDLVGIRRDLTALSARRCRLEHVGPISAPACEWRRLRDLCKIMFCAGENFLGMVNRPLTGRVVGVGVRSAVESAEAPQNCLIVTILA